MVRLFFLVFVALMMACQSDLLDREQQIIDRSAELQTLTLRDFPQKVPLKEQKAFKILFIDSWEATLLPLMSQKGKQLGGLNSLASLINAKWDNNTIFCCVSDYFQGDNMDRKPVIQALNLLNLSVATLGTLDLNNGPGQLRGQLRKASFDVVSVNVYEGSERLCPPYTIKDVGRFKVAFIGVTSREVAVEVRPHAVAGLLFKDPAQEIRAILPEVQEKSDIIVILSNLSYEKDLEMARLFPQTHIIIGRYNPLVPQTTVENQVVITRPSKKKGLQLGEIRTDIKDTGELVRNFPKYYDVGPDCEECQNLSANPFCEQLILQWQQQEQKYQEILCRTDVDLIGKTEIIRTQETNLGNLIADILLAKRPGAHIALINGGAIRSSIPKGNITCGMICESLPYKNKIVELEVPGNILKEVLENSVAKHKDIKGAFLQVAGISFTFNADAPTYSRVTDITIQGELLQLDKKYKIVTADFIASGGDDYVMLKNIRPDFISHYTLQDVIIDYLRQQDMISPKVEDRIRFVSKNTTEYYGND